MINAPSTNSRRWRSSVNLPEPTSAAAAFDACDKGLLLDAAAGRLDGCPRACGHCDALEHDLLVDLALLHDLGVLGGGGHQLGCTQCREVDGFHIHQCQLVK